MKIARISLESGPRFAQIDPGSGNYRVLAGDPLYQGVAYTGQVFSAADVRPVSPVLPRSKVVVFDSGDAPCGAGEDSMYLKPNTSVTGPDTPLILPSWGSEFTCRPMLAAIISRPCKEIPADMVAQAVYGYTLVNLITAVEYAGRDPYRAFGFDTSCASGPALETELEPGEYEITLAVDGEVDTQICRYGFSRVQQAVSAASTVATLLPADLVTVCALHAPVPVSAGTDLAVDFAPLGVLRNPVVADR